MAKTELIIIGGANGSGKTTLAREILNNSALKYLGADDIAFTLNEQNPAQAAIEAARIFSRKLGEGIENGENLLVESTLSGISLKKFLVRAKEKGFKISVYFVYLDSAELCIRRITSRVTLGGHHVPPEDVRRRFGRSNENFRDIYAELADEWHLFLNSGADFQQVAAGDKQGIVVFNEAKYPHPAVESGEITKSKKAKPETLQKAIKLQRLGNRAVKKAQEENRKHNIPNWYSIDGVIISEREVS